MPSRTHASQPRPARLFFIGSGTAAILLLGGWAWHYYSTPPPLQASPQAAKTLDAMFTALTSRDQKNLSACIERIEQYSQQGMLATRAAAELRSCNDLATAGSWEQAAERLYWVIYEQR